MMLVLHLTDDEIMALAQVRYRAHRSDVEYTPEFKSALFYRRLYRAGRIGRGDNYSSGLVLRDLPRALDFAGVGARREPPYRGGG